MTIENTNTGIILKNGKRASSNTFSVKLLVFFFVMALLAELIANQRPLFYKNRSDWGAPAFKDIAVNLGITKWSINEQNIYYLNTKYETVIFPLITYSDKFLDQNNADYVSPFSEQTIKSWRYRHWLGTDQIGRDVLAGIIYGTRKAIIVGLFSMLVSLLLGTLLGTTAGYFADTRIKTSGIRIGGNILVILLLYYNLTTLQYLQWKWALENGFIPFLKQLFTCVSITFLCLLVTNLLFSLIEKFPFIKKDKVVPADLIISRIVEVFESIPVMFLVIGLIAIAQPSLSMVILIIGLTSWTPITRYVRNEMLRIRQLEYIEAAKALGYSEFRIILKHALPNSLNPVIISLTYGIAGAILAESTLSFLGIGLPADEVTWGSLLAGARQAPQAWWLALVPGACIFLTVLALNKLGERITRKLSNR